MPPHRALNLFRIRGALATPQSAAGVVHDTDRGRFLRYVQTDIVGHRTASDGESDRAIARSAALSASQPAAAITRCPHLRGGAVEDGSGLIGWRESKAQARPAGIADRLTEPAARSTAAEESRGWRGLAEDEAVGALMVGYAEAPLPLAPVARIEPVNDAAGIEPKPDGIAALPGPYIQAARVAPHPTSRRRDPELSRSSWHSRPRSGPARR